MIAAPRPAGPAPGGLQRGRPRTMFEKIWARHVVAEGPGGHVLLYVDRHLLHEGTTAAFGRLARSGRSVRRPDLSFATADHYCRPRRARRRATPRRAAWSRRSAVTPPSGASSISASAIPRRGIVHVIGPEQGLTGPGITLVCGDSHTATHGAFGALAFGIGSTRGRARAGHADPVAEEAADDADLGRGPAGPRRRRQGRDPRDHREDRRRRRRAARDRVRGLGDPRACRWTSA